jgi:hypothetical protein
MPRLLYPHGPILELDYVNGRYDATFLAHIPVQKGDFLD